MRRRLNREKALLAFAVLLLSWALVKWGIFLGTRPERLGAPVVSRADIRGGDTHLADRLPAPPLSRYALGDDPFRLAQRRHPTPGENEADGNGKVAGGQREEKGAAGNEGQGKGRVVNNDDGKTDRGGKGKIEVVVVETDDRIVIEPLPHADLPLRLVGTVKAGGDEPARRALIQDTGTGAVRDARVGDLLPGDYKLSSIQDDSVIVIDPRGRSYVLGGRHQEHYN
jgi:hypothetical protein